MSSLLELRRYEGAADSASPRTRKQLLWWLWKHSDFPNVDLYKSGPYYTIQHGRYQCATRVRRIDSPTFADWKKMVNDTGNGWGIA